MSSKQSLLSRRQGLAVPFLLLVGIAATSYQRTLSHLSIPIDTTLVSSIPSATTPHPVDESRRKTNVEVLAWLLDTATNHSRDEIISQIPFIFPRPVHPETVQIYNVAAWHDLQRKLVSVSTASKDNFTVLANGGSVSAGASSSGERYYVDFINYLQTTGVVSDTSNVHFIDRAHGWRGSIHSALMWHNFFPPKVDLVLWEFAINDMLFNSRNVFIRDPVRDAQAARRSLEMWMDTMAQMSPQPPHVILVYLWDTPFRVTKDHTVSQLVYDAHKFFAARYPFVVGHVNMARYVEELEWDHKSCKQVLVHDFHHPVWLGHAVMGYLLSDLMTTNPDRLQRAMDQAPDLQRNVTALTSDFACDGKLTAVSDIIDQDKVSLADWTAEAPRNTQIFPGMLELEHASFDVTLGKQDPTRTDRQRAVGLPCCHLRKMVTLKLPQFDGEMPVMNATISMQVRAIHATILRPEPEGVRTNDFSNVSVFLDGEDVAKHQVTVIDNVNRSCWTRNPIGGHWLVLPKSRQVRAIGLCSHRRESCGKSGGLKALLLQTLSVWK